MAKKIEIEQTEIEAPYELPEGWKWCRLGDVIETSKEKTDTFSSEMKYVGLEHIDSNGKINGWTSAGDVKSLKNIFHANQILYGKLRPYLNKHDIADFTGVCSTDILVFNAKTDCSNKYINYFFNLPYFIDFAVSNSKGINLPRVSERIILEIPFPLPPTLAEQQRIVNRIETMFAKLDQAQEKAQSVLDSFETRKAAILHKAFTGELTANWRKENGVSDESWEEKTLQDVCEKIVCGKTPKEFISTTGDIPYLKVYNISNNKIDFETIPQFIPKEIHEGKLASSILKPYDVVMNIVGPPLRKIAIIPEDYPEWNMNQAIVRFRPLNEVNYKYLYWALINPKTLSSVIEDTRGVVGQQNISVSQSRNLIIPVPTLPEQQEIVRILDNVLEKENRAKEAAQTVLDQIALLKKSILARAFRGEL